MSADRTAAVIRAAWRRQGWQVRPETADEAINTLTSQPRHNDCGGRYQDFDQRVAYVCRLVEWRLNTTPDADTDVADRFIGADAPDAFGAGLYRALTVVPYDNTALINAMFAAGLHRALSFLTAEVRMDVGRELLKIHAPVPQMVAAE